MWPALTIGVVFTEKPIYYRYTSTTFYLSTYCWKISLIRAEKPQVFPDFIDWKKFSKFFLISLIGGNPVNEHLGPIRT